MKWFNGRSYKQVLLPLFKHLKGLSLIACFLLLVPSALVLMGGCHSNQVQQRTEDVDLLADPAAPTEEAAAAAPSPENGGELDASATTPLDDSQALSPEAEENLAMQDQSMSPNGGSSVDEFDELEKSTGDASQQQSSGDLSLDQELELPPGEETPKNTPPVVSTEEMAPPVEEPAAPSKTSGAPVTLQSAQFKAHDGGGTLILEADREIAYKTRMNSETNQFIVELPRATLPDKMKRPLVTKDFEGPVGSIDFYQSTDRDGARVVLQLRPGAVEPILQREGNSLLIIAGENNDSKIIGSSGELSSLASLEEFLSGNTNFYGKKISIETSEADVKDILRFISEDVGINIIVNQDVAGKMTVKLRDIPWDQALTVILKSKSLAYTRAGNILRVGTLETIRKEEEDAIRLSANRKAVEPLRVKLIPLSYSDPAQITAQANNFRTDRGKIVGDNRTSSIIITDTRDGIERVEKFIRSIDIPPTQVLIEGKIVEANENFERQIGVNWSLSGSTVSTGLKGGGGGTANLTSSVTVNGADKQKAGDLSATLQLGTLDVLGTLTAALNLREREGMVKIISAPRILTLHNEEAEISQNRRIPMTQAQTINGNTTVTVQYQSFETTLKVKPQVTNDASIILNMDIKRQLPTPTTNDQFAMEERATKTKVIVKNGQTAVIGGIYQSDNTESETRVPWAANLPVVGWLFKVKSKVENKNELLIFLTPRIVNKTEAQSVGG